MRTLKLSDRDTAALDRPIWSALHAKHRSLALGGPLAFRYPPAIAPFAAVADFSPAALAELRKLALDGPVALLSSAPLDPLDGFQVKIEMVVCQMVFAGGNPDLPDSAPDILGTADVPAMVELTALTKPGPFSHETHRFGRYIGIHDGARLAAMAGERLGLDGYTEISAVCVHPDHRGKGYAQLLVKNLMKSILARAETPFLHVLHDNQGAITLYERLGFVTRTTLRFTLMGLAEPA